MAEKSDVEQLLEEQKKEVEAQKSTNVLLEVMNDNKELLEEMVLQQMESNDELSSVSGSLSNFGEGLKNEIINLSNKFSTLNIEREDIEIPEVFELKDSSVEKIAGLLPAPARVVEPTVLPAQEPGAPATPVTFENGEIVPVVQSATEFLGRMIKNDTMQLMKLEQISDRMGVLVANAESIDDVGTVGAATDRDGLPEEAPSASGIFDGLFGTGGLGAIGKKFPKFGKFLGVAKKGLKIFGPIVAAGVALFDFADGIENASEIIGKPKESLSALEKAGAGMASIVEGLTFGLIDAKDAYAGLETIGETVKGLGEDIFDMLPNSVQKGLKGAFDFLTDEDFGIFGRFKQSFTDVISSFETDGLMGGLKTLMIESFQNLFGFDGIVGRAFKSAVELGGMAFDSLPDEFQTTLMGWKDSFVSTVSGILNDILDFIPTSVKDAIGSGVDKIKDVGSSISSFFGFGEDSSTAAVTQAAKPVSVLPGTKVEAPKIVSNLPNLDELKRRNPEAFGADFGNDPDQFATPADIVRVRPGVELSAAERFDASISPAPNRGIAREVDSERTVNLSKQRFQERNARPAQETQAQPVVVQIPEKKQEGLTRRTGIDDVSLAVLNSGLLDG